MSGSESITLGIVAFIMLIASMLIASMIGAEAPQPRPNNPSPDLHLARPGRRAIIRTLKRKGRMKYLVFAWVLLAGQLVAAQTTRAVYRSGRDIIAAMPADLRPDLTGKDADRPLVIAARAEWLQKHITNSRVQFVGKIRSIDARGGGFSYLNLDGNNEGRGREMIRLSSHMRVTQGEVRRYFLRSKVGDDIRCTIAIDACSMEVGLNRCRVSVDGDFESKR